MARQDLDDADGLKALPEYVTWRHAARQTGNKIQDEKTELLFNAASDLYVSVETLQDAVADLEGAPAPVSPKITDGMIWIANSALASTEFGNGISYTEMRHLQSDWIDFQFLAHSDDDVEVEILYSMSAAQSADIRLRVDTLTVGEGSNPSAAAVVGTPATLTVTNDVLAHKAVVKTFSIVGGTLYHLRLNRLGSAGEDTHTGEIRIIEIRVK